MRSIVRQYWNIQAVASDCSSSAPGRQVRPVEGADVVEAEEAAREEVVALLVLAVQPPREVDQQLVEDPLAGTRSRGARRWRRPGSAAAAWTGGLTSSNVHS